MKKLVIAAAFLMGIGSLQAQVVEGKADRQTCCSSSAKKVIYDYKVNSLNGNPVDLNDYKGKVILVVNTASKCGLTPQYKGLEAMYQKYKDKGFVVLGFPCNQFLGQEPGDAKEIASFCEKNYGVSFPMFEKIEVRGANTHPLYQMLMKEKPFKGFDDSEGGKRFDAFISKKFPEIYAGDEIKWNFTKFLIDRNGKVIQRIEPNIKPANIEADVVKLL
jgi:glutathione peroxidase